MVLSLERWLGKVAVVTGASSGIGAAITDVLVQNGLTVVGLARRVERIQKRATELAAKKGRLLAVAADLRKEEDILLAFDWISKNVGPVHILINNAGIVHETTLLEGETEAWRNVFDVNVIALCIATREAFRIMNENQINGHIVHINSTAGHKVNAVPKMNVYPASKHAVTALTETLRQELNGKNSKIKITSVSPGLTVSELTTLHPNLSKEKSENYKSRPILKAEDVAEAVLYTLSTPEHVQVHELTIKPLGDVF